MAKIKIDLNHIQTDSFEESEFLHHKSAKIFLELIDEKLAFIKNLNKNNKVKRIHNTILVNGKRGFGKTSFLLTMIKEIQNNYNADIEVLDIVDPTIVETKESIFILILSLILQRVERSVGCEDIEFYKNEEIKRIKRDIAKGLNVLDGIGEENLYNDPEILLIDGLSNTKNCMRLEDNFHRFIDKALEILNKKMFLVVFDDVDTSIDKAQKILELIRKYFTTSKLQIVLAGDVELYKLIIRNIQWKKMNVNYIKRYEGSLIKDIVSDEVNTLAEQYFIKIFRNEHIVDLNSFYRIAKNNDVYIWDEKIDNYIKDKFIKKYFKEETKITDLINYFYTFATRSIIQLIKKPDLFSLRNIVFNAIDVKYSRSLSEMLDSFSENRDDKFYMLYRYIQDKNLKIDYRFLPEHTDTNINHLAVLLNAYISNSIINIQNICDYFVKFYAPIMFYAQYDYNTHSFKIIRYLNKDIRVEFLEKKVYKGTIEITQQDFKNLKLDDSEQALFNIFVVGLFTKNGLKNYFSFWNIFGFISDMFLYKKNANLKKLLQIKSFYIDEQLDDDEENELNYIQEKDYDVSKLQNLLQEFQIDDISLSNRHLHSIFTRIEYSIKYIDNNPSSNLYLHLKRYINATLNSFIVVTLENEKDIDFRNSLNENGEIFNKNKQLLEKNQDKYKWLWEFVNLEIWNIINIKKYESIILGYYFKEELKKLKLDEKTKSFDTREQILSGSIESLYKEDISNLIAIIKKKDIKNSIKNKIIKDLESIRNKLSSKRNIKNDGN